MLIRLDISTDVKYFKLWVYGVLMPGSVTINDTHTTLQEARCGR
jgi:hypothetical protein